MKRLGGIIAIAAATAFVIVSCGGDKTEKVEDSAPERKDPAPVEKPKTGPSKPTDGDKGLTPATTQSVQQEIVNQSCLKCHSSSTASNRHVDLTDISELVGSKHHHDKEAGEQHGLIVAGCPEQSYFYTIMKEGKMPKPPMAKVEDDALKVVKSWILGLEPNAKCKDSGGSHDGH